jgi:hypothetical protein
MLMSNPHLQPGIGEVTDYKLPDREYFWNFRISLDSFVPDLGIVLLRQKCSWPGRVI